MFFVIYQWCAAWLKREHKLFHAYLSKNISKHFKNFLIPVISYFDEDIINLTDHQRVFVLHISSLDIWLGIKVKSWCRQKIYLKISRIQVVRLLKIEDIINWVNTFIIASLFRMLLSKVKTEVQVFQELFIPMISAPE